MKVGFRLLLLMIHVFAALLAGVAVFPLLGSGYRNRFIQRLSIRLLAICGVDVKVTGMNEIAPKALVVANHLSWLDIYLINSLCPSRFIAKAEISKWPILGWLSRKSGTVFIERSRKRDLRKTFQNLIVHLRAGERFAFFPEGTTATQGNLLPFHANLFEAAIGARIPVQPYAIRYLDASGNYHSAIDFSGNTTFLQSVFAVLRAERITAELTILPTLDAIDTDRRKLACAARNKVACALIPASESRDS